MGLSHKDMAFFRYRMEDTVFRYRQKLR